MVTNGDLLNPLSDVPLVGDLVGLLDTAANQAGIPFWFRSAAELVLAGTLAYLVLRLATARLLPWAGEALVAPVLLITHSALVLLLLPDLGISRLSRHFDRPPPEVVYAYGSAVVATVEAIQQFTRTALPKLELTKLVKPWLLVGLLAALFLLWNSQHCLPQAGNHCVSPVQAWISSVP